MTDRIYTRTGDSGETGLFGGGRVPKAHPRVEAYGEIDELNAQIGWAMTVVTDPWIHDRLAIVQDDLFALGAHLATPEPVEGRRRPVLPPLPASRAAEMESWMDEAEAGLEPLRSFILPGGSQGSAALHVCRGVCRRAERRIVQLAAIETVEPAVLILVNRLSDFLFMAARRENTRSGVEDVKWDPSNRAAGPEERS